MPIITIPNDVTQDLYGNFILSPYHEIKLLSRRAEVVFVPSYMRPEDVRQYVTKDKLVVITALSSEYLDNIERIAEMVKGRIVLCDTELPDDIIYNGSPPVIKGYLGYLNKALWRSYADFIIREYGLREHLSPEELVKIIGMFQYHVSALRIFGKKEFTRWMNERRRFIEMLSKSCCGDKSVKDSELFMSGMEIYRCVLEMLQATLEEGYSRLLDYLLPVFGIRDREKLESAKKGLLELIGYLNSEALVGYDPIALERIGGALTDMVKMDVFRILKAIHPRAIELYVVADIWGEYVTDRLKVNALF